VGSTGGGTVEPATCGVLLAMRAARKPGEGGRTAAAAIGSPAQV
jgi:hypothetical protein